jgi:hypothetical protein
VRDFSRRCLFKRNLQSVTSHTTVHGALVDFFEVTGASIRSVTLVQGKETPLLRAVSLLLCASEGCVVRLFLRRSRASLVAVYPPEVNRLEGRMESSATLPLLYSSRGGRCGFSKGVILSRGNSNRREPNRTSKDG